MDSLTRDAGDLFKIAVRFAGFDAGEVMKEIMRLQKGADRRASVPTVERALHNVANRDPGYVEFRKTEMAKAAGHTR